jgi:hypothetical protein
MAKKYLFDLSVASSALLQVNPKEFYAKTLLSDRSTARFRQLLNIKEKTKIANVLFADVLQEAGCDFAATNQTLSAKEMEPCKFQIGVEICQDDIETSFLADWMKPGSAPGDFMSGGSMAQFATHFYEELRKKVNEELEVLTFQGDTDGNTNDYLELCDGLEKQFAFEDGIVTGVNRITGTTVTSSNVVAELTKVYNAIPKALKKKKAQILWMVSPVVADAYRLAVATASAEAYTTKDADLKFLGYTLTVCEGISDYVMMASLSDNFIFLTDLVSDAESLQTIDMSKTTGDRKIRAIGAFKFGVNYVNPSEIVTYGIAKQS